MVNLPYYFYSGKFLLSEVRPPTVYFSFFIAKIDNHPSINVVSMIYSLIQPNNYLRKE